MSVQKLRVRLGPRATALIGSEPDANRSEALDEAIKTLQADYSESPTVSALYNKVEDLSQQTQSLRAMLEDLTARADTQADFSIAVSGNLAKLQAMILATMASAPDEIRRAVHHLDQAMTQERQRARDKIEPRQGQLEPDKTASDMVTHQQQRQHEIAAKRQQAMSQRTKER